MTTKTEREWREQIASMSSNELFERWEQDLERLSEDVHRIHWNRETFEAFDEEIVRTQREGSGFFLERFLRPMYVETQSLLLRRLGDDDRRSSSFRVLLEEMMLRPELLTRERHVDRWAAHYLDQPEYIRLGDEEFSESFGAEARHVPVQALTLYRDTLNTDLELVQTFVNKSVAHQDRVTEAPITWKALNQAIDNLEIHLNAIGLIVSGGYRLARATVLDPWRNVFQAGLFLPPTSTDTGYQFHHR
jgi:hypothetical protein